MSKTKKEYKSLTLGEKVELIHKISSGTSAKLLSREYGIDLSMVYRINRSKNEILTKFNKSNPNKKRLIPLKFPKTDEATFTWYCTQRRQAGVPLSGTQIKAAAIKLNTLVKEAGFEASDGWLHRFQERHNIKYQAITGRVYY